MISNHIESKMNLDELYQLAKENFIVEACESTTGLCAFNIVFKSGIKFQIIPNQTDEYNVLASYSITGWHNCVQIFNNLSSDSIVKLYDSLGAGQAI